MSTISRSGFQPKSRWRLALIVGFGALVAVTIAGAADMWLTLRQIHARSASVLNDYMRRDKILERVRTNAYLSTTLLRDFVLDPDPSHVQTHLDDLHRFRGELEAAISDYTPLVESNEKPTFDALRAELLDYWKEMDPLLDWPLERRIRDGFRFLASRILPQRARLLALTDAIGRINEQELHRRQSRLDELYVQARLRLALVFAFSLALGGAIASLSFLYLVRLERRVQMSFEEICRTHEELERLSQRLVAAQEQERRALARELHDEVGQSLSALLLEVSNATAVAPPGKTDLRARLDGARHLAEQSLRVIRNMALLLRPSMLDDLGLVPAIEWQAREMSRRTGLDTRVEASGVPDDLDEAVRTCVYRIVQEALNNCQRHSSAQRVEVVLDYDQGRLLALVRDDGRGFSIESHRGAGLIGMDERVRALGGTLRIESSPGRGCIVQATVPVESARAVPEDAET